MSLFGVCPICKGKQMIQGPSGLQICPKCDGTGDDPGVEVSPFFYVQQFNLTALQLLPNQRVVMLGTAPFRLKLLTRTKTGDFRFRMFDSSSRFYSSSGPGGTNDLVRDSCMFGDGSLPFVIAPHPVIDKSGFLGFDLQDVSNANNAIELCFTGALLVASPPAAQ